MKRIVLGLSLACIALLPQRSQAQREPQNVRRVIVTSSYVIENGQRTSKFFATKQEIYDSLGRMHTEIFYNNDHYPQNYTWHEFDGNKLKTSDYFVSEKLAYRLAYKMNGENKVTEIKHLVASDKEPVLYQTISYTYKKGLLTTTAGKDARGKTGFKATHKYDNKGTEISRKVKVKNTVPLDSIVELTRIPAYDSLGRIISKTETITYYPARKVTQTTEYTYNNIDSVATETLYNEAKAKVWSKEYIYRPNDKRLQQVKTTDANGTLVEWTARRFELYPTRDRRNRILE